MMTVVDGEHVLAVLVKMLHQRFELCRVDVPRNQLQKDKVPVTGSFVDKSNLRFKQGIRLVENVLGRRRNSPLYTQKATS